MLHRRLVEAGSNRFGGLQGSFHGAEPMVAGFTLCTWMKMPGGLPVVFHAEVGGVPRLLSIELEFSKSPNLTRFGPPCVSDTLSTMAAPRVPEVNLEPWVLPSP